MKMEDIMKDSSATLPTLRYLFTAYLHQDWDIEGDSLLGVFQNHAELQKATPKMKPEINILLDSGASNESLDELFIEEWSTGYDPDDRYGETWQSMLQELSDICDIYNPDYSRN